MFGVFTFTSTHFVVETTFPEGMGEDKILVESSEGWGVIFCSKYGISGEEGSIHEIPSMVGVWIFSATTLVKRSITFYSMYLTKL